MERDESREIRDRIKDIERRVKAAPTGPWSAMFSEDFSEFWIVQEGGGPQGPILARCCVSTDQSPFFIAHARQDIPWLLAYATRLQNEKGELATRVNDLERRLITLGGDTRRRE